MPSATSFLLNLLVLGLAVSLPAAFTYFTHGDVPDLATIAILFIISFVIFQLLGVPSLIDGLTNMNANKIVITTEIEESTLEDEEEDEDEGLEEDEYEEDLMDEDGAKTPVLSARDSATADIDDPYITQFPPLEAEFCSLADTEASPAGPPGSENVDWHVVLSQSWGNFSIEIHKRVGYDFFFRHVVQLEGTPEETFDLLSDITKRPSWDELCQEAAVLEQVSNRTVVQYFRTKGMWPTKPRVALVVGFTKLLSAGRYLNVTKSIDSHPHFIQESGDVRMNARIAGQIVEPDPQGRPRMCRVVQIVDGDLGGWLPKSIVSMVTTQAIPIGMRRANKILRKTENHKTVSDAITTAEGKNVIKHADIPDLPKNANGSVAIAAKSTVVQSVVELRESSAPSAPDTPRASRKLSVSSRALTRRSASNRALMQKPNTLRFMLHILRRSQPWVVISLLLALITGRFKR